MSIESIIAIVMSVAGLLVAFLAGKGRAESKQKAKERKSINAAKRVSDEHDSKSDDAVRSDAARWVRSDRR